MNNNNRAFELVLTGMLTALILAATIIIRIPVSSTNGYVHLGDTVIYLTVLAVGRKKGAFATGTGSALADLLSGYAHYVPWTFVIKALMAFVMGTVIDHMKKSGTYRLGGRRSLQELFAMSLAGLEMTVGYYIAASIMYANWVTPLLSVPGNIAQFVIGMLLAEAAASVLVKTPVRKYLVSYS